MLDLFTLPGVDEVRPLWCPRCRAVAEPGGPKRLHGHGPRVRETVVPGEERASIARVFVRRYLCTACTKTCTVHPAGVLPRFFYSLYAIVNAWLLSVPRPVGRGLGDAAVYARQGVDRCLAPEAHRPGPIRWRSLARWAGRIGGWWPGRAVAGSTWRQRVGSLLAGFTTEGDVTERALASHVLCGGTV